MDNRFLRAEAILGPASMEKLRRSHVAVLGLGGVGSWCAEALARAGVGAITVMDMDTVSETNVNRQSIALSSTLGQPKAEVMARRIRDIAPECAVTPVVGRYEAGTREEFFAGNYDFIADAIDLVACKLDLICEALRRVVPIISALGTGNKRDAGALPLAQAGERGVFCDAQDPGQRVFAAGAVGGRALPDLQECLLHHILGGEAVAQDGQGKAVDGIFCLHIQLGKRGFVSGGDAHEQLLADRRMGGVAHSGDLFFSQGRPICHQHNTPAYHIANPAAKYCTKLWEMEILRSRF